MDFPCLRIVCYGLGNFENNPHEEKNRIEKFFKKYNVAMDPIDFKNYIEKYHINSAAQLEFLIEIKKLHNVPTFVYDPLFTDTERKKLQSLGFHVLEHNSEEFVNNTLYYLPYCPHNVSNIILQNHAIGDTIAIIGNPFDFVCNQNRSFEYKKIKGADQELYLEQYILKFI
jgi:hypothetical protein